MENDANAGESIKRYPRAILATVCVPWNEDGTPAEDLFRDEIRNLVRHGICHIYLFGTAGEGYAVTETQFDALVKVFADEMSRQAVETGRHLHPMVGVISLSMATLGERIRRACDLGIAEFQISLPAWSAVNDREMFGFFHAVCDAFPNCRFLHYNLMRTKRLVTPEEYARLADEIPNLVATKNASPDIPFIYGLERRAAALRHFMTEIPFGYGSLIGAPGFLISIASSHFERATAYYEAGCRREAERVLAMQAEILDILRELMAATEHRSFIDGAYDKIFCKLHDPRFPLRLLPPYEAVSPEMFARYAAALRERHPMWVEPETA